MYPLGGANAFKSLYLRAFLFNLSMQIMGLFKKWSELQTRIVTKSDF